MKRRKKIRRIFKRCLIITAVIAIAGACIAIQPVVSKVNFLKKFHLQAAMVFNIEVHSYWNDFLKYTDGYEFFIVRTDADEWDMPDSWNTGTSTVFEILHPYGLGYSTAIDDELNSGEIPIGCKGWFVSDPNPNASIDDREFFVGTYDGQGKLFLYRGHHLYGDEFLRLTGE